MVEQVNLAYDFDLPYDNDHNRRVQRRLREILDANQDKHPDDTHWDVNLRAMLRSHFSNKRSEVRKTPEQKAMRKKARTRAGRIARVSSNIRDFLLVKVLTRRWIET